MNERYSIVLLIPYCTSNHTIDFYNRMLQFSAIIFRRSLVGLFYAKKNVSSYMRCANFSICFNFP